MATKSKLVTLDNIILSIISSDKFWAKFDEHIGIIVDQKLEEKGVALKSDLKYLPTKEEFYKKEDEVLGELKSLRDEVAITSHQYKRTNKRVDLIDKHLNINTSNLV